MKFVHVHIFPYCFCTGSNAAAIAGHAISQGYTLISNNTRELARVEGLIYEDWVH